MSLEIKDGAGSQTFLKTTLTGSEHMPHHIVQGVSGTVSVTSSMTNPVYVTGNVSIEQPLVVSSITNTVNIGADFAQYSSSLYGALIVTSSQVYPVIISGSIDGEVEVLNYENTALWVTSSQFNPVYVSASADRPVHVISTPGVPVYVTSSEGNIVHVSASANSPVPVTSSGDKPVFVVNDSNKPLFVTSSDAYPVVTKNIAALSTTRTGFSSYAATIDWTSANPNNISGTFILAQTSSARKGLMFANNTNKDLYIALGDNDFASTNGFGLSATSSAPYSYSFTLYPSGTYFADPSFVNIKHSGFFVSSSNIDVAITVVTTE